MSPPSPGPVSTPGLSRDDSGHPGFVMHYEDNTPGHKTYLSDINAGVEPEPLTAPSFAPRFRYTHDNGPGGRNSLRSKLRHDVLHRKYDVVLAQQNQNRQATPA
ncbi:hypothetical protein ACGFMK_28385 [Amycolatopsis sp. NPDC049252]|uniref:hypothetical protein n=1 Tax=Amycolatopsis sp. NPDC049252 TaxID=3363933 RepID=UPI003722EA17